MGYNSVSDIMGLSFV